MYACHVLVGFPQTPFLIRSTRWWLLLRSSTMVCSTLLQVVFGITRGDLKLVRHRLALATHLMELLTKSSCADAVSWSSLKPSSECCNCGQTICKRYGLQLVWSIASWLSCCCSLRFPLQDNSALSGPTSWKDCIPWQVTELFSTTHSALLLLAECQILCTYLVMSVAETAKPNYKKGCPHTFSSIHGHVWWFEWHYKA